MKYSRFMNGKGRLFALAFPLVVVLLQTSCDNADEARDKTDFITAECGRGSSADALLMGLVTSFDRAACKGLTCIAYKVTAKDTLHIDLINYWENCDGPYEGEIFVDSPNDLRLEITKSDCGELAKCSCPYDFSLEVDGIDIDGELTVTVVDKPCNSDVIWTDSTTLPLADDKEGIRCRYEAGMGEGGLHGRCVPDSIECVANQVCSEVTGNTYADHVCLKSCVSSEQCPIPGTFTCEEGVCRLIDPIDRSYEGGN